MITIAADNATTRIDPIGYAPEDVVDVVRLTGVAIDVVKEVADTDEVKLVLVEEMVDAVLEVAAVVEMEEALTLLVAIPNRKKYWADESVAMMSSANTQRQTTVPFLYWCV